ncbi:hypothetical protein SSP35_37_00020 [Streptomyces sp. NBRC 110611]|nr:hypothetical protein SSP35_37_00020 [Streptomyces sp. NBRC 110611]
MRTEGKFAPPTAFIPSSAVTYDMSLVPAGAHITVTELSDATVTTVELSVSGLRPHRIYGTHVHTKPCGYRPDNSGPHYQHREDVHQPSTDPAFANHKNEVWLDFTTDAKGQGGSASRHEWRFRTGEAQSIVIHERGTATGPGKAGTAGARLACFTVPFGGSNSEGV